MYATVVMVVATIVQAGAVLVDEDGQAEPQIVRINPAIRERPQPGSVRLKNGLVYSGICSKASTLSPERDSAGADERYEQNLEMRLVDQTARQIYLPVRRSEPHVLNNLAWPNQTFVIAQKRVSRKSLPAGIPVLGSFNDEGVASGTLHRTNGTSEELRVGIVGINELYADVSCLTHHWDYSISFASIPRAQLPGILSRVDQYRDRHVRQNLVALLIKADRLPEAARLFETLKTDFPELANSHEQKQIREEIARQIASVLEHRRELGQHRLASNGARVHPRNDLTPETIVRVTQLKDFYSELDQRMEQIRAALPGLVAQVQDETLRKPLLRIQRLVCSQIDEDTIDRFAAYELTAVSPDDSADTGTAVSSDEKLALALSGWLMGADNSVRNLNDVVSLFEAREKILDYLDTDVTEAAWRHQMLETITGLEGVSIARVAAIVRHLPAFRPVQVEMSESSSRDHFRLEATPESLRGTGLFPPEYHESRQYPVLIALHGPFDTPETCLRLWQSAAEKNGFIVVAPDWLKKDEGGKVEASPDYYTSAEFHHMFRGLLHEVKQRLRVDDDRIFIAGHGFGGDMAMDVATSHSDTFAGIVSICGTGHRHIQWTASNAILMPWYVLIGDAQDSWFERMNMLSAKLFRRDDEMDIDFDTVFVKYPSRALEPYLEEMDSIFEWMSRYRRMRFPEKVYARILRSSDLNWSWVRLKGLPSQFAQLDRAVLGPTAAYRPAELNVRRDDSNLIRIKSAPADVTLLLAPDMPGLDVNRPIRIHNGRRLTTVDYDPQIAHLLEELYRTGDRSRLCFMRVEVTK